MTWTVYRADSAVEAEEQAKRERAEAEARAEAERKEREDKYRQIQDWNRQQQQREAEERERREAAKREREQLEREAEAMAERIEREALIRRRAEQIARERGIVSPEEAAKLAAEVAVDKGSVSLSDREPRTAREIRQILEADGFFDSIPAPELLVTPPVASRAHPNYTVHRNGDITVG